LAVEADSGIVKLLDFGVAKSEMDPNRNLTQAGIALGTPAYMAPEQLAGVAEPRSDLYSAAIVLYELITGDVPYGELGEKALYKRLFSPVLPLRAPPGMPPIPEEVVDAVAKMLATDVNARFADVRAAVTACEHLLADALRAEEGEDADVASDRMERTLPGLGALAGDPTGESSRWLLVLRLDAHILEDPLELEHFRLLLGTAVGHPRGKRMYVALFESPTLLDTFLRAVVNRHAPNVQADAEQVTGDFQLTEAAISGAAALPTQVALMVERLA
jgi:serine/threonine protein kinase